MGERFKSIHETQGQIWIFHSKLRSMNPTKPEFGAFGGHWSEVKLSAVQAYFTEFNKALSKTSFTRVYIDAFAGGGRVKLKNDKKPNDPTPAPDFFSEIQESLGDSQDADESIKEAEEKFRHGSPLLALDATPGFHEFIFIERDAATLSQLETQVREHPSLNGRPVEFINDDANHAITKICRQEWSRSRRATIFLDPFALQLRWSTIEDIAQTEGMDMWMLFPAMGVNRMLPRSGEVPEVWAQRLTETFGDSTWRQEFYAVTEQPQGELFAEYQGDGKESKLGDPFGRLSRYVTRRLKTVFADAVESPLVLKTESNSPLFLLCFAVANKRGAPIAKRIAEHIIKKHGH